MIKKNDRYLRLMFVDFFDKDFWTLLSGREQNYLTKLVRYVINDLWKYIKKTELNST